MKRCLLASLLICTGALAQPASVQRLAWLQGCWALETPERTVEEHWMAPRAGTMLGMSRTVRSGKLSEHESVLLREHGDRLEYAVSPSGRPTTVFTSTRIGEASIVFENLQHDFPQRVAYERKGDDLLAWIEGPMKGQTRRIEFAYRKVACEGR